MIAVAKRNNSLFQKKILSFSLKLVLTGIILFIVLHAVSLSDYKHVIQRLSFTTLLSIMGLVVLQVLLLAFRWNSLARAGGSHLALPASIFGILMSFFFSQGLPASIGGDTFRLWWHRREGISTGNALNIIIFDRIYGLISLVLLCFVSVYFLATLLSDGKDKILSLSVLILTISLACGLFILPKRLGISNLLRDFLNHLPHQFARAVRWFLSMRDTLSEQKIETTLFLLILGILTHLLVVIQVLVVGCDLDPNAISLVKCLAAVPPALVISYMPFSIAGWGVREASMVVAFGLLGVSAPIAIMISLIIGLTIFSISLIGGLIWLAGGYRAAYSKESV